MAIRSCGSSMKPSSSSARSSWRKRAELSIVTLESRAITSRSLVTTIGLTSIRVASLSLKAWWSFTIISAVFPRASSSTPASATSVPACASPKPSCGLDVAPDERVRVLLGDLLDVHPAHRREHRQQLLGRAVEDDRRVVLGLDLGGALDPDLVDGEGPLAARSADVHAEDRIGVLLGLLAVLRDLDPARLAAAADLDLRLDHARVADLLRRLDRGLDGVGDPSIGYGDPVAGEELLSLILEQIQGRESLPERRSRPRGEADAAESCKLP